MRILITLLAMFSLPAAAATATIQWELPTEDCAGQPVGTIEQVEIFLATSPIAASGQECPADGVVDAPPADFDQAIDAGDQDRSLTVELTAGQTYYARMRVRTADGWSNLSNEVSLDLPEESVPPGAPLIINFGG